VILQRLFEHRERYDFERAERGGPYRSVSLEEGSETTTADLSGLNNTGTLNLLPIARFV